MRRFIVAASVVRCGQRPPQAFAPLFDGATDVLQQQRLSRHQVLDELAIDLQRGHLVERVRGRGDGFACQRGLAQEVALLQSADGNDGTRASVAAA